MAFGLILEQPRLDIFYKPFACFNCVLQEFVFSLGWLFQRNYLYQWEFLARWGDTGIMAVKWTKQAVKWKKSIGPVDFPVLRSFANYLLKVGNSLADQLRDMVVNLSKTTLF